MRRTEIPVRSGYRSGIRVRTRGMPRVGMRLGMVCLIALAAGWPRVGRGEVPYVMAAGSARAARGAQGVVLPIVGTYPGWLGGFQAGLRFDPDALGITSIDIEGTLVGQLEPDFFLPRLYPDAAAVGVLMDMEGETLLPPGAGEILLHCTFDVLSDAPLGPSPVTLEPVGDPPIGPALVPPSGMPVVPPDLIVVDGLVAIEAVPAPERLRALLADDLSVSLAWVNNGAYDAVRVARDGETIATLAGDATGHVDGPAPGAHAYEVRGVVGAVESEPATAAVHVGRIEGAVWVTAGDRLERFDLAGTSAGSYPAGPGAALAGVAVAPDGTIWTGDPGSGRMLRWAPDGSILQEVPGSDAAAVDRLGAVWAVDRAAGTATRIAPDGRILLGGDGAGDSPEDGEEGPAVALDDPFAVAADAYGIAWISEHGADAVAKVAPNGSVLGRTTFAEGAGPAGIAVDSKRRIWVALRGTDHVAALAADGSVLATYATQDEPTGVAVDAAGRVWVTNAASASVTRVDPISGAVDDFPVGASGPHGIGADALGAIWVVCRSGVLVRLSAEGVILGTSSIPTGSECLGDMTGLVVAGVLRPKGDADGDGFLNVEELDVGADPFDPTSDPTTVLPGTPASVTSLGCSVDEGVVTLSWVPREAYDGIRVLRDGETLADLAGTAEGYEDPSPPEGRHDYAVVAERGGPTSPPAVCAVRVGLGALVASVRLDASTVYDIARNCFDGSIFAVDRGPGRILHYDADLRYLGSFFSPFGRGATTGIAFNPGEGCATGDPAAATLFVADGSALVVQEIDLEGHPVGPPIPIIPPRGKGPAASPASIGTMTYNPATGLLTFVDPEQEDVFSMYGVSVPGHEAGELEPAYSFDHVGSEESGPLDAGITFLGEEEDGAHYLLITLDADGNPQATEVVVKEGVATVVGSPIPLDVVGEGPVYGLEVAEGELVLVDLEGETLSVVVAEAFLRADANGDGAVNIADPVFVLNFIFADGAAPACMDAADANDSGTLDIADAVYILNFQFASGPAPPAPFPEPGADPTDDDLEPCGVP